MTAVINSSDLRTPAVYDLPFNRKKGFPVVPGMAVQKVPRELWHQEILTLLSAEDFNLARGTCKKFKASHDYWFQHQSAIDYVTCCQYAMHQAQAKAKSRGEIYNKRTDFIELFIANLKLRAPHLRKLCLSDGESSHLKKVPELTLEALHLIFTGEPNLFPEVQYLKIGLPLPPQLPKDPPLSEDSIKADLISLMRKVRLACPKLTSLELCALPTNIAMNFVFVYKAWIVENPQLTHLYLNLANYEPIDAEFVKILNHAREKLKFIEVANGLDRRSALPEIVNLKSLRGGLHNVPGYDSSIIARCRDLEALSVLAVTTLNLTEFSTVLAQSPSLTHLQFLNSSGGRINSTVFTKISKLMNLRSLFLENLYYSFFNRETIIEDFSHLATMPYLEELRVVDCDTFSDIELEAICRLPHLRRLMVSINDITGKGFRKIKSCTNLQFLKLHNYLWAKPKFPIETILEVAAECPPLREIDLQELSMDPIHKAKVKQFLLNHDMIIRLPLRCL